MAFKHLDTQAFSDFIDVKDGLIQRYDDLCKRYDTIISGLKNNWEGQGADAFFEDSDAVRSNIVGIRDILQTMCDTLEDCNEIFHECDKSLKSANEKAMDEQK